LSDDQVSEYYKRKLRALVWAKPDLVALETLPSIREAGLAMAALKQVAPSMPAWVSFICRSDSETTAGDDFGVAVATAAASLQVAAVGLNCTSPRHVQGLLRKASIAAPFVPLAVYPNSGELWDAREDQRCWHGTDVHVDGRHASDWKRWGARVIGGCCRVSHSQIREFRQAILGTHNHK